MAYFPLFVDLEGRQVLVVGGGKIAMRRVRTLLEFGCEITVVSPEVCEELREKVLWKKKSGKCGRSFSICICSCSSSPGGK